MGRKERHAYAAVLDVAIIAVAVIISITLIAQHNNITNVTSVSKEEKYFRHINPQTDLIFGNPNADLFIIEYGDLECPFCKEFHPHIKNIIQSDWGVSGKVAWIWRNGFHMNKVSVEKARTLECIRLHGGDKARSKAWSFIEESLIGGVEENEYPFERYRIIMEQLDIPFERVNTCRKNNEISRQISEAAIDVKELNIIETPLLQFVSGNGELLFESVGSLTKQQLEAFIVSVLQHSEGA